MGEYHQHSNGKYVLSARRLTASEEEKNIFAENVEGIFAGNVVPKWLMCLPFHVRYQVNADVIIVHIRIYILIVDTRKYYICVLNFLI